MSSLTSNLSIVSQLKLSSNIAIANCNLAKKNCKKVYKDNIWDTVISSDERWEIVSVFKSWNHLACFDIQSQCDPKEGHQFSISVPYSLTQETELCLPGHFEPSSSCEDVFVSSVFYELWSRCSFLSYTNLNGLRSNMKELTALSRAFEMALRPHNISQICSPFIPHLQYENLSEIVTHNIIPWSISHLFLARWIINDFIIWCW